MLNFCDFIQVYVFTTNHHLIATVLTSLHEVNDRYRFSWVGF